MLTVSNYHYIRPDFKTEFPSIFGVTPQVFREQLLLLKNEGDFIDPKTLLADTKAVLESKQHYFFITFDDGLKEQYQYALPILDELNIPAVFFANSRNFQDKKVSTVHKIHLLRAVMSPKDFLTKLSDSTAITFSEADKVKAKSTYIYDDENSAVLKYILNFKLSFEELEVIIETLFNKLFDEQATLRKLYMDESEIIDLSTKSYLGSHTHNHYPIGLLDSKSIEFELRNSKLFFEKMTGSSVEMVAYPYGSPEACTSEVAQTASHLGYKLGFTTTRGVNTSDSNYLLLNRFDCNDLKGGKNFKK